MKRLFTFLTVIAAVVAMSSMVSCSKDNPNGRWRKYSIDEIRKRDGLNLDLSWMDLAEKDNRTIHEILSEMDEERNSINKAMDTLKELLAEVNL